MGDLSRHFNRSEVACKCRCGYDTVDFELLYVMELIRQREGAYTPNSVCRCGKHNAEVGGGKNSQHLFARAGDIPSKNPISLYEFLDDLYPDTFGIGVYDWGIHVDTRRIKARWDRRT